MQAIAGDPLEAPGRLAGTVYYTGGWTRALGVGSRAKAVGQMGRGQHGRLLWNSCRWAASRLAVGWRRCLSPRAMQVSQAYKPRGGNTNTTWCTRVRTLLPVDATLPAPPPAPYPQCSSRTCRTCGGAAVRTPASARARRRRPRPQVGHRQAGPRQAGPQMPCCL